MSLLYIRTHFFKGITAPSEKLRNKKYLITLYMPLGPTGHEHVSLLYTEKSLNLNS